MHHSFCSNSAEFSLAFCFCFFFSHFTFCLSGLCEADSLCQISPVRNVCVYYSADHMASVTFMLCVLLHTANGAASGGFLYKRGLKEPAVPKNPLIKASLTAVPPVNTPASFDWRRPRQPFASNAAVAEYHRRPSSA